MSFAPTSEPESETPPTVSHRGNRLFWIVCAVVGVFVIGRFSLSAGSATPRTHGLSAPVPAVQPSAVSAQVDGVLANLLVREGDTVKKGDLLAELDPAPFRKAVEDAEKALAAAKSQTRQAVAAVGFAGQVGDPKAAPGPGPGPAGPIIGRISGSVVDLTRLQVAVANAQKASIAAQSALQVSESALKAATAQLESAKGAVPDAENAVTSAESDFKAANAAIEAATARKDKAKVDSDHFQDLYKDGVVSRHEAEKVTARYTDALAAENAARDQAQSATEQISQRKQAVEEAQKQILVEEANVARATAAIAANRAKAQAAQDQLKLATTQFETAKLNSHRARGQGEEVLDALNQAATAPVPVQVSPIPAPITQANIEKAEATLKEAQRKLAATKIYAPVSGRVRLNGLAVGATVRSGVPLLVIQST